MKDKANSRIAFFFLLCILTPGIITAASRMRIWGTGDVVNPKELSANLLYLEDLILSRDGGGGASIPIADKETPGILNLGSQDITKGQKTFYAENDLVALYPIEDFYEKISYTPLPVQNYWNGFSANKAQFCTDMDASSCILTVKDGYMISKILDGGYPSSLTDYNVQSYFNLGISGVGDNDFGMSSQLATYAQTDAGNFDLGLIVSDYVNLYYDIDYADGGHMNNSININQTNIDINAPTVRIFNASLETYATITDNTYMNNLKLQNRILIKSGSAYNMTDGGSGWFLASQYPLITSNPMYGNYSIEYQAIVEDDAAIGGNKFAVECLGANNEIILDRENTILNLLSTNMTYNSGGSYSIHWEIGSVAVTNSYTDGGYINCNLYYKSPEHVSSGPVTDEYLYKLIPIGL